MTCMLIYVFSQLQHNRSPSLILKQWYQFSLETLPCKNVFSLSYPRVNKVKLWNGRVWTKCRVKYFCRSKICPVPCKLSHGQTFLPFFGSLQADSLVRIQGKFILAAEPPSSLTNYIAAFPRERVIFENK